MMVGNLYSKLNFEKQTDDDNLNEAKNEYHVLIEYKFDYHVWLRRKN